VSTVLVGVGGGGLLAGVAVALKRRHPHVRVVGVQASGACAFATSWRSGRRQSGPARTVADGMAVQLPGALPLALAARHVDDVVTVPDDALWAAMALLLRKEGHVVEPAGAAGVAALLVDPSLADGPTAVILSGGNIDPRAAERVAALARRRGPAA
jgi:threonine dehydratase